MNLLTKKILLIASALGAFSLCAQAQVNPKEKLGAALTAIQSNYVDSVSEDRLTDAAIRGMLSQLDPHSQYYDREQIAARRQAMGGSFAGIGIQFLMQHDTLYVTQVIPGGPAEKAGLIAGDRITKIDGRIVAGSGLTNPDIMKKIRGEVNTKLDLEIVKAYQAAVTPVSIVRGAVADHSVKAAYMITTKIGYISIGIFSQTTRVEVDAALKRLKQQGMESLILDLQGNGGGYVEAALGVADEFLKKDQLVYYTIGNDKGKDYFYAGGFGCFSEGNLVVLIDQGTASASEILTSALQDWDRAIIVGRRSFGKGLMQKPVNLFDGSVLELTGARYYAPSGRSLQKPYKGVSYQAEISSRYTSGELFDKSVIKFPDSLQFKTQIFKRIVYGGMGVMPDQYVPLDTTTNNAWLRQIAGMGLISKTAFDLTNQQRSALKTQYPDFKSFNQHYAVPNIVLNTILRSAAKNGLQVPKTNKMQVLNLLASEIKGQIAGQLFGGNNYNLQVTNQNDGSYNQGLRILEQPELYNQYLRQGK